MASPYASEQPVYIKDPSGRLGPSGMTQFNFPYTPTISSITNTNYSSYDQHILIFNNVHLNRLQTLNFQ